MGDTSGPVSGAATQAVSRSYRLTKDGLPVDQNDWTYEDWKDLYCTMERLKRRIAARHRAVRTATKTVDMCSTSSRAMLINRSAAGARS